jgi:hypothetical protein
MVKKRTLQPMPPSKLYLQKLLVPRVEYGAARLHPRVRELEIESACQSFPTWGPKPVENLNHFQVRS